MIKRFIFIFILSILLAACSDKPKKRHTRPVGATNAWVLYELDSVSYICLPCEADKEPIVYKYSSDKELRKVE